LVGAHEQRGVAADDVPDEGLVGVARSRPEGLLIAEAHVDGTKPHVQAGFLGMEFEDDALVGLDAHN
jgi:hypothetical protein